MATSKSKKKANTKAVLSSLIETLDLCESKVKDGSLGQVMEDLEYNFSMEDFWLKLGMTFRAVSKEATNLAVMFLKPPAPSAEDLEGMLTGFETAVIGLLTVFHSLPLSQGKALHKRLQIAIVNIVHDAKHFVDSLMKEGSKSSLVVNHPTGAIWESCDAFHRLPLDNKFAVLEVFITSSALVRDALTELDQIQSSNGHHNTNALHDVEEDDTVNEQGWSEKEAYLIPPCVGMVKACRSCLKKISDAIKTNGKTTSLEQINEMDEVAIIVTTVSPKVDDLVSGLYAPLNHNNLSENINQLADILVNLLEKSRDSQFTLEADNSWLDFLKKAVEHNKTKFVTIIAQGFES
ncbi:cyclin-D1-binding protein 1 homolog [Actinia tenebrosa]|uniref:Cyclin-D1-binding protein 1 homolog n=1 Tax=Actinia tenebrosa TaxID=6105 RepID=A0A6P8I8L4_ACTTE|nr:cyclin-D1-binding protein 1 homolog [Actinia tenebrosa]